MAMNSDMFGPPPPHRGGAGGQLPWTSMSLEQGGPEAPSWEDSGTMMQGQAGQGYGYGQQQSAQQQTSSMEEEDDDDPDNDPPLLEELGVDMGHIKEKTLDVLNPKREIDHTIMRDSDIAGPLLFCLVLGFCLLFSGKLHFGYIYGFGLMGTFGITAILNLMSQEGSLDLILSFSVLGYCLLPIVFISAITVIISLNNIIGGVLTFIAVSWSTYTATRFFEAALQMQNHRYLIAYPTFLVYASFALITVL